MTDNSDLYRPSNTLAAPLNLAEKMWEADFGMATAIHQRVDISVLPGPDIQMARYLSGMIKTSHRTSSRIADTTLPRSTCTTRDRPYLPPLTIGHDKSATSLPSRFSPQARQCVGEISILTDLSTSSTRSGFFGKQTQAHECHRDREPLVPDPDQRVQFLSGTTCIFRHLGDTRSFLVINLPIH